MKEYIVKFKNDLKRYQSARKKIIKQCEYELSLFERLINNDPSIRTELNRDNIDKQFPLFAMYYSIENTLNEIFDIFNTNKKRKKKQKNDDKVLASYKNFSLVVQSTKNDYTITQNIINAFENDKIKEPINDMNQLFEQIKFTSLTIEEISRIIGMTISFNTQYAKKNKNHNIIDIEKIKRLSDYYNSDGSFKFNEDFTTFKILMESLFEKSINKKEDNIYIMFPLNQFSIDDIVDLLKSNNDLLRNNISNTSSTEISKVKEDYSIEEETIKALQELRKYYKNGTIIEIPDNLEEFYKILDKTNLDEQEKLYIINLINQEISNKQNMNILHFLTEEEQNIYEKAIKLLNSFTYSNGDTFALKQYIEELQTISYMLNTENDEENKEYLLSEVPSIIEQLAIICDRYTIEDKESSNRFIFLLNKESIPYICDDIDSLDQSYKKAIHSLIPKINKENPSQFRKILSNEQLPYTMYEVTSPRAHVAFIEIDAGIYLIIGANIPRTGYKELINRLKANQSVIKQIEESIKNPNYRNEVLVSNEEYLPLFIEQDNQHLTRKLESKNS